MRVKLARNSFSAVLFATLAGALLLGACAAPGQVAVNTPEGRPQNYPPSIEDTPQRRQAAGEAWKKFASELQLPEAKPELEPILNTPRAMPAEWVGKIGLSAKNGALGDLEAKEALRRFIERFGYLLFPDYAANAFGLKDLSLTSFSGEGNFYRAVYRQANYSYPIADGFGELRLTIGKNGSLLQWESRIIPLFDQPTRPEVAAQTIVDKLVNREFTYTSVAGQPLRYKVTDRSDISVKDLVIYPKESGNKMTIHFAYLVEVGRGTTWTVYVDAVTGQELGVKQNFAT